MLNRTPPSQASVASPQVPSRGGHTRFTGGGPNTDEGTESLVLYVYYDLSLRAKRISICTLYGEVAILHVFAVEMGRKLRPNSLIGGITLAMA